MEHLANQEFVWLHVVNVALGIASLAAIGAFLVAVVRHLADHHRPHAH